MDLREKRALESAFEELNTAILNHFLRQRLYALAEAPSGPGSTGSTTETAVADVLNHFAGIEELTDEITEVIDDVDDVGSTNKYAHPILNISSGRRLYYFLITVKTSLLASKDRIEDLLGSFLSGPNESLSLECQCSYVVLGDQDFLVKVWASEVSHEIFSDALATLRDVGIVNCLLVYKTDTWYERAVDQRLKSKNADPAKLIRPYFTREDEFEPGGDILTLSVSANIVASRQKRRKFWILVEHPRAVGNHAIREFGGDLARLCNTIIDYPVKFVSVYFAFQSNGAHSIILKAESLNPIRSIHSIINRLHSWQESYHETAQNLLDFSTSTYICVDTLHPENHVIKPLFYRNEVEADDNGGSTPFDVDDYKKILMRNLLINHRTSRRVPGLHNAVQDRFILHASQKFDVVFENPFSNDWFEAVHKLRRLFMRISHGEYKYAKSFLLEGYVEVESTYSSMLEPWIEIYGSTPITKALDDYHNSAVGQINQLTTKNTDDINALVSRLEKRKAELETSKSKESGQITLGGMAQMLKRIATKETRLDESASALLKRVSNVFEQTAKERNPLMHGRITDISISKNARAAVPWHSMVKNYIDIAFFVMLEKDNVNAILNDIAKKNRDA